MENGYIYVHNNVFPTLLAISDQEHSFGLMGQEWPPPIMSFAYPQPKVNRFWMARTPSPLDIVFCHQGKVSQIHFGEPFSTRVIGDNKLSDLIFEFPHGTVDKIGIKIGHMAGLIQPTFEELKNIISKNGEQFSKY